MRITIAVLAFLMLAGCGSKSPGTVEQPDEPGDEPTAETAADAVAGGMDMLEHIAATIEPAESCADKGAALRAWVDDSQDEMAKVSAQLRSFPEEDIGREVESQMDGRPIVKALFETSYECSTDETFAAAWAEASAAFESK